MRRFTATLGSVGMAGILLGSSLAVHAEPLRRQAVPQIDMAYPNEAYTQYGPRRGFRPPPPRYYRYRHRHHYHHNGSSALAAGAVGLAAGALIGSAIASSQAQAAPPPPPGTVDPQLAAYCARKYRSYDPVTGTFLASNGMRYVCTY
ncbi:BA14K family protein [Microvirga pakistanensis]|uniref:BA14K family protein n=1 Tax=Microvirga pakistanensis TaxID=1682650 RepID=UPI00106958A0|nr:BA14K family protein [Microvirga pakistanensis]